MRGRLIKNAVIVLLCFFFLLSGKILFSIGTNSLIRGEYNGGPELPLDSVLSLRNPEKKNGEQAFPSPPANWGKDPFRNLKFLQEDSRQEREGSASEGEKVLSLKVEGISLGAGKAFAVINGKPLAPGEGIQGYIVKKIRLDEVVLEKEGREIVLKLWDRER